jgi:hypothetical protein
MKTRYELISLKSSKSYRARFLALNELDGSGVYHFVAALNATQCEVMSAASKVIEGQGKAQTSVLTKGLKLRKFSPIRRYFPSTTARENRRGYVRRIYQLEAMLSPSRSVGASAISKVNVSVATMRSPGSTPFSGSASFDSELELLEDELLESESVSASESGSGSDLGLSSGSASSPNSSSGSELKFTPISPTTTF